MCHRMHASQNCWLRDHQLCVWHHARDARGIRWLAVSILLLTHTTSRVSLAARAPLLFAVCNAMPPHMTSTSEMVRYTCP